MQKAPQRKTTEVDLNSELLSNSRLRVWEAAVLVNTSGDRRFLPTLLKQLTRGPRPFHRRAAAYALGGVRGKRAVLALERVLLNSKENPKVRAEAAEALAYLFGNRSIPTLRRCLADPSRDVRFWCAFTLGVAGTLDKRKAAAAIPALEKLAASDRRVVRGFWSVAGEARWAALRITGDEKEANKLERRLRLEQSASRRRT
jgi:HEAT repeat protein